MDIKGYLLNNEHFINILCNIFTSLGTVGAVIFSLYLAYRSNNPKPKIAIAIKPAPPIIKITRSESLMELSIINKSNFSTKLSQVYFRIFFYPFNTTSGYVIDNNQLKGDSYLKINRCLEDILDKQINSHAEIRHLIKTEDLAEIIKLTTVCSKWRFINILRLCFYSLVAEDIFGNIYKIRFEKNAFSDLKKKIGI